MKKIAFHCNHLSLAGTEIAVYDYAHYNEEILENESIIIAKINPEADNPNIIKKFESRFNVIRYTDFSNVEKILDTNKIDIFHVLKSGENNRITSRGRKSAIHVVFPVYQPHGNVYAYISKWLSKQMNYGLNPWVPHMVDLPKEESNMRDELNIPQNAIVFGRYGSYKSFDLPFVFRVIKKILEKKKNIYFLFPHTHKFYEHERVIHLDLIWDLKKKVKFINTCDAMLHARLRGETFGLACGEFSLKNKPVITYGNSPEKAHINILKNKGFYYYGDADLYNLLNNFEPQPDKNWDAYSKDYNPTAVMNKFKQVFL